MYFNMLSKAAIDMCSVLRLTRISLRLLVYCKINEADVNESFISICYLTSVANFLCISMQIYQTHTHKQPTQTNDVLMSII